MEIPYIKLKFASDKPTPPLSDKPSKYCISDNMSLFLLLLLLLLCLSLQACGARPFGVVDIERIVTGLQLPHKNIEPSRAEGLKVQEPSGARIDKRMILPDWGGANTIQEKNSQTAGKENEDDKGYSVLLPSPQMDLHETSELEDQERRARSIMESPTAKAEETVDSMENDEGEDIVVMDYAQPHRKPPIHNRRP